MLDSMFNLLFGCRHRRFTRPITPVHKPGVPAPDTYVACLECGKQFHYDTANMRMGEPVPVERVTYDPIMAAAPPRRTLIGW